MCVNNGLYTYGSWKDTCQEVGLSGTLLFLGTVRSFYHVDAQLLPTCKCLTRKRSERGSGCPPPPPLPPPRLGSSLPLRRPPGLGRRLPSQTEARRPRAGRVPSNRGAGTEQQAAGGASARPGRGEGARRRAVGAHSPGRAPSLSPCQRPGTNLNKDGYPGIGGWPATALGPRTHPSSHGGRREPAPAPRPQLPTASPVPARRTRAPTGKSPTWPKTGRRKKRKFHKIWLLEVGVGTGLRGILPAPQPRPPPHTPRGTPLSPFTACRVQEFESVDGGVGGNLVNDLTS